MNISIYSRIIFLKNANLIHIIAYIIALQAYKIWHFVPFTLHYIAAFFKYIFL